MVLNRTKKKNIIKGIKGDIDKANAVFLTNLVGIKPMMLSQLEKSSRCWWKSCCNKKHLFELAGERH